MSPPRLRQPIIAVFLIWTAVGLFSLGQSAVIRGSPVPLSQLVLTAASVWLWALYTPLIWWLSERYPFRPAPLLGSADPCGGRFRAALRGGGAQRHGHHAGAGHAAARGAAQRLRSAPHRSALLRGDRRHRARPPVLPPLPATGVGPPGSTAARARGAATAPLPLQRPEHHLVADPRSRGPGRDPVGGRARRRAAGRAPADRAGGGPCATS